MVMTIGFDSQLMVVDGPARGRRREGRRRGQPGILKTGTLLAIRLSTLWCRFLPSIWFWRLTMYLTEDDRETFQRYNRACYLILLCRPGIGL